MVDRFNPMWGWWVVSRTWLRRSRGLVKCLEFSPSMSPSSIYSSSVSLSFTLDSGNSSVSSSTGVSMGSFFHFNHRSFFHFAHRRLLRFNRMMNRFLDRFFRQKYLPLWIQDRQTPWTVHVDSKILPALSKKQFWLVFLFWHNKILTLLHKYKMENLLELEKNP
jgi:hypothetical protein